MSFVIREDKRRMCVEICREIEKCGEASKYMLSKSLPKWYSAIRKQVDWLASKKVGILKIKGVSVETKPGRREIFYTIKDGNWLLKLQPASIWNKIWELMPELTDNIHKIRTLVGYMQWPDWDEYTKEAQEKTILKLVGIAAGYALGSSYGKATKLSRRFELREVTPISSLADNESKRQNAFHQSVRINEIQLVRLMNVPLKRYYRKRKIKPY